MVLCGFNTGLYGLWVPGMFRFMPPENVTVCASQQEKITKEQIPIIYQIIISSIITIHYNDSFSHNEVISPWRNHKRLTINIRKVSRQKIEPDKTQNNITFSPITIYYFWLHITFANYTQKNNIPIL